MSFHKEIAEKLEYQAWLSRLKPKHVKFVGEKKLTCPFWGTKYFAVLFCGIDTKNGRPPVWGGFGMGSIDSSEFSDKVIEAVASGWLRRHDVLVMTKAKYHTGGENTVLEDWLWKNHKIYVLYLPAGTPKWTPVTAMWKDASKTLNKVPKDPYVQHDTVRVAKNVLNSYTHREMEGFYADCYTECGL